MHVPLTFASGMTADQREKFLLLAGTTGNRNPKSQLMFGNSISLSVYQTSLLHLLGSDVDMAELQQAFGIKLPVRVDLDRIEKSLTSMIEHYEVLRTCLFRGSQRGQLRQRVFAPDSIVERLDLSARDLSTMSNAAARHALEEAVRHSVNIYEAPALRACLFRLPDHSLLVLVSHLLLLDDWSVCRIKEDITEEIAAHVNALSVGKKELGSVFVPRWLRTNDRIASNTPPDQDLVIEEFWRKRISTVPAALQLSPYIEPIPVRSTVSVSERRPLSHDVLVRINQIQRETGVTQFIVLAAAVQVWIYLRTGRTDFAFGTMVDSRMAREMTPDLGYFVSAIPLVAHINADRSFSELLADVMHTLSEDLVYCNLPSQHLVQHLAKKADSEQNATQETVFNTILIYRDRAFDDLPINIPLTNPLSRNCQVLIEFQHLFASAQLEIHCASRWFTPDDTRLMADQLLNLLVQITREPGQLIMTHQLWQPSTDRPKGSLEVSECACQETLLSIWKDVLRYENIGIDDHFYDLGGNSLNLVRMVHKANIAGLQMTTSDMDGHPTIRTLSDHIARRFGTKTQQAPQMSQAASHGVPLLPAQRRFFEVVSVDVSHYNISQLFTVSVPIDPADLSEAVVGMPLRHDALQLRFVRGVAEDDEQWQQQVVGGAGAVALDVVDLAPMSSGLVGHAVTELARLWQSRLNIEDGPLVHVGLCRCGEHEPARLCITIHHLVSDALSFKLFTQDLFHLLAERSSKEKAYPVECGDYIAWAQQLEAVPETETMAKGTRYLVEFPWSEIPTYQIATSSGLRTADQRYYQVSLAQDEVWTLTRRIIPQLGVSMQDVLLATLGRSYLEATGQPWLYADVLEHGRIFNMGTVDVSGTAGWFAFPVPFPIMLTKAASLKEQITQVGEQRQALSFKSGEFGIARYYTQYEAPLSGLPAASMLFNYLGDTESFLPDGIHLAPEVVHGTASPRQQERYSIKLTARIRQGALELLFAYDPRTIVQIVPHLPAENLFGWLSGLMLKQLRSLISQ